MIITPSLRGFSVRKRVGAQILKMQGVVKISLKKYKDSQTETVTSHLGHYRPCYLVPGLFRVEKQIVIHYTQNLGYT